MLPLTCGHAPLGVGGPLTPLCFVSGVLYLVCRPSCCCVGMPLLLTVAHAPASCCVGRFQRNSECCEKLAQSLHHLTTIEERGLFDFGSRGQEASPLVLILDRKDDPVTPLLLQWTYQAMVHELIGLDTNRLDLSHIPGVSTVTVGL